jgi:hypothetical protein
MSLLRLSPCCLILELVAMGRRIDGAGAFCFIFGENLSAKGAKMLDLPSGCDVEEAGSGAEGIGRG